MERRPENNSISRGEREPPSRFAYLSEKRRPRTWGGGANPGKVYVPTMLFFLSFFCFFLTTSSEGVGLERLQHRFCSVRTRPSLKTPIVFAADKGRNEAELGDRLVDEQTWGPALLKKIQNISNCVLLMYRVTSSAVS